MSIGHFAHAASDFRIYDEEDLGPSGKPRRWPQIVSQVKCRWGKRCGNCRGRVEGGERIPLRVYAINGVKADCRLENLIPLCAPCREQIGDLRRIRVRLPKSHGRFVSV